MKIKQKKIEKSNRLLDNKMNNETYYSRKGAKKKQDWISIHNVKVLCVKIKRITEQLQKKLMYFVL